MPHANPTKCYFFTNSIDYLIHVNHPRLLELASRTSIDIRRVVQPTWLTEQHSFHCFTIVSRCSVFRIARIAAPLNQHLERDKPTSFTPLSGNELCDMKTLKTSFIFPPILNLFYSSEHMTLVTDECNVQTGCSLQQKHPDDKTKPVKFCSHPILTLKRWKAIGHNPTQMLRDCMGRRSLQAIRRTSSIYYPSVQTMMH